MRSVIIRDDDTNAFTPPDCLERLYRPFLDRGLPVNLSTIPDVSTEARTADGRPEGFLFGTREAAQRSRPIGSNPDLVRYLLNNPAYRIVQHGLHHHFEEFGSATGSQVVTWLNRGTELLRDAGFPAPVAFVAPQDRLSRAGLGAVAERFRVLSTGWFELGRLPVGWWPRYALKKVSGARHWKVGHTLLLSHPGCLLSCFKDYSTMLDTIIQQIQSSRVTVLVTHWWEYFPSGRPDEAFIGLLHQTAEYLASRQDLRVIAFEDLVRESIPLN